MTQIVLDQHGCKKEKSNSFCPVVLQTVQYWRLYGGIFCPPAAVLVVAGSTAVQCGCELFVTSFDVQFDLFSLYARDGTIPLFYVWYRHCISDWSISTITPLFILCQLAWSPFLSGRLLYWVVFMVSKIILVCRINWSLTICPTIVIWTPNENKI